MQTTLSALETALTLAAGAASAQPSTIFKGKGFGTYYYDIQQRQACGTDFNNQDLGSVMRNRSTAKSLNDVDSSNLVAMSNLPLKTAAGLAKYCGKRVVVTVNGVKSNVPFFIGDGLRTLCARRRHSLESGRRGRAGLFVLGAQQAVAAGVSKWPY